MRKVMDGRFMYRCLRDIYRKVRTITLVGVFTVITGGFVFAQSVGNVKSISEDSVKALWVVDGVALNDSVFDYTLEQMKSDSAELLAALSLRCFERMAEIRAIDVLDSLTAARQGFVHCNGVVKIETLIRRPMLIIVNGLLHNSRETVSGGDMLCDNGKIDSIIANEVRVLEPYGVKKFSVIKDFGSLQLLTCRPLLPIVVIETEKPYYHYENLIGHYEGKAGRQKYDLRLNANSTYVFTRQDKKSIFGEVVNSGIWKVDGKTIRLLSGGDREGLFSENYINLDSLSIAILSKGELLMPKSIWSNKKSVKLKILFDYIDDYEMD